MMYSCAYVEKKSPVVATAGYFVNDHGGREYCPFGASFCSIIVICASDGIYLSTLLSKEGRLNLNVGKVMVANLLRNKPQQCQFLVNLQKKTDLKFDRF